MLFAIKADAVAERAIQRLKEGKKPVIAFSSTMAASSKALPMWTDKAKMRMEQRSTQTLRLFFKKDWMVYSDILNEMKLEKSVYKKFEITDLSEKHRPSTKGFRHKFGLSVRV